MTKAAPLTYKDAGVDIEAGEESIARIADAARKTHIPGVVGALGGFGGLFALKDALGTLRDPILVSGTDGVGTKLLVAIAAGRHDGIGQDLVAMCVNDILTSGARPLFFLDYFATGALAPARMAEVVCGIARACEQAGCALLGGETAEMPGMYPAGEYDLAGFVVGAVERDAIVDGARVEPGHHIIGLPSTGLHANGLSLARKVLLERMGHGLDDRLVGERTVADVLLEPTALYVRPVLELLDRGAPIHAMAHITGGGLSDNLTRSFPASTAAQLDVSAWQEPEVFQLLRAQGPIEEAEMRRTFNLGIGYCLVVPASTSEDVVRELSRIGQPALAIGEVISGNKEVYYRGGTR